jgi:hypothetical protein
MSVQIIKQFNEILSSFLIQISPLVGTTYHHHFETIIKYNNILPIEQFLIHALPIRDKILNRDESYFTDENIIKEKTQNDTTNINEILRLQNIYTQLDDASKSNVWDIFQAMLILGEDYIKLNQKKFL